MKVKNFDLRYDGQRSFMPEYQTVFRSQFKKGKPVYLPPEVKEVAEKWRQEHPEGEVQAFVSFLNDWLHQQGTK